MQIAIQETLQNRGTVYEKDSFARVLALAEDKDIQVKWHYILKTLGNPDIAFAIVMEGIKTFLLPIWEAIVTENEYLNSWESIAVTGEKGGEA